MIEIDVIGTIYTPGTYDADGGVIDAPVELAGYHVNATHPVGTWEAKRVTPASPMRVFGGAPTVFYTFDNEAEFDSVLEDVDLTEPPTVAVSLVDPCEWLMDVGPFFDRFGAVKMAVLSSSDAVVKAIVADVSVRKWVDLQRPDVASALVYIGSKVAAVNAALQTSILTTPVVEADRMALRKLYFA